MCFDIIEENYNFSVESTALRLIMGLGSSEVQPQLSRMFSEPKTMVLLSSESEELNRALVLTLARAMHVTGEKNVVLFLLSYSFCKKLNFGASRNQSAEYTFDHSTFTNCFQLFFPH